MGERGREGVRGTSAYRDSSPFLLTKCTRYIFKSNGVQLESFQLFILLEEKFSHLERLGCLRVK